MSDREDGANVRLPPPAVYGVLVAAGLVVQFAVRAWPTALDLDARIAGALVFTAIGAGLGLPALQRFRATGQDPKPWKPTPSLVAGSVYRITRNPMYVGMFAFTIAIGLGANASWVILAAPIAELVVHVSSVLPEEAYLANKFGADYEAYRKRVPRYF